MSIPMAFWPIPSLLCDQGLMLIVVYSYSHWLNILVYKSGNRIGNSVKTIMQ